MDAGDWYNLAKESTTPGLVGKAKNLLKATLNHVATGMHLVSPEVQQERMDICKPCEFYDNNSQNPHWSVCGCFLNIKTTWASEGCPIGKWESVAPIPRKGSNCGGCGGR